MKNYLNYLKISLTLLTLSSCKLYGPPKTEVCLGTEQRDLACTDLRIEEEESQSYFREVKKGDVCTNPTDYVENYDYVARLRKKLIKCERSRGRRR